MQVSWIDADDLNRLLRQLEEPVAKPTAESLPAVAVAADAGSLAGVMKEWMAPTAPFAGGDEGETRVEGDKSVENVRGEDEDEDEGRGEDEDEKDKRGEEEDEGRVEDEEDKRVEEVPTMATPEVARIRDRLREVRARALAAGLLRRAALAAAPADAGGLGASSEVEVSETATGAPSAMPEGVSDDAGAGVGEKTEAMGVEDLGAGMTNEPEVADSFEVPLGSLLERVEAFAQWAGRRLFPAELVLLDERGEVVWGAPGKGELAVSVLMAAGAAQRASAAHFWASPQGVVRQAVGEGREMMVATCPTRAGVLHLAVERSEPLPDDQMLLMVQALASAINAGH